MNMTITILLFIVWGIFDLLSQKILFDNCNILGKKKIRGYQNLWILYYFAVTLAYCFTKYKEFGIVYSIMYFAYYFRMVPYLCSGYGINAKIFAITFFFEQAEAVIASSLAIIGVLVLKIKVNHIWLDDSIASFVSVAFYIILRIFVSLRKKRVKSFYLSDLSFWDYILLIVTVYLVGDFETDVCLGYHSLTHARLISMLSMLFLLILSARIIFINEQKFSTTKVVAVLDEQMKKQTKYYEELNRKDTELREYRHDIRNHLIVINSMIKEGRYDNASEYVDSLEKGIRSTATKFRTGSFIVDALLEDKLRSARENGTVIEFNGLIPKNRIEDVDMVILFSNMIDNAIEACEKIQGRKIIYINSAYSKCDWVLTVKNPVADPVKIDDGYIKTTKMDDELHGIGIEDMANVVRKYDGMLRLFEEKNIFTARATLHF